MKTAFRTRSVGTKVTEEEYAKLETRALDTHLSISEWCRAVLLEKVEAPNASGTGETLLAEVLALRTILLNLHFAIARGEAINADEMQAIIERADRDKETKAALRLAPACTEQS